jgi:16S rRNA (uracil1498-N3)-methyltransferase
MEPNPETSTSTKTKLHRFYLPSLDFNRDYLEVFDHRIVHQAGKVLRMRTDDFFRLFDGQHEFQVQIAEINKRRILVNKVQEVKNETEPKIKLSLYQAIPKSLPSLN